MRFFLALLTILVTSTNIQAEQNTKITDYLETPYGYLNLKIIEQLIESELKLKSDDINFTEAKPYYTLLNLRRRIRSGYLLYSLNFEIKNKHFVTCEMNINDLQRVIVSSCYSETANVNLYLNSDDLSYEAQKNIRQDLFLKNETFGDQ